MSVSAELAAFTEKQNGIYDNFRENQANILSNGVEVDGGTAMQSGYLVAWRFPEAQGAEIARHSRRLSEIVPSVVYGHDEKVDNAHVTLSDLDVVKERQLDPADPETAETLLALARVVEQGINAAGGLHLPESALTFQAGVVHNGRTAIMPGQPSQELFNVRQSVIDAANESGIGFKGAWGAHSTVSRVLQARSAGDVGVAELLDAVHKAPVLGAVRPSSLDVGYFNAGPEKGFDFQPVARFDVTSGPML